MLYLVNMNEKKKKTNDVATYWDYLKLDQLLSLQNGFDDDESRVSSDELTFIVVHQVYELWFKIILRELRLARDHLSKDFVPESVIPRVVHHLNRVINTLELAIDQFKLMESLAPQDFLAFRNKLGTASGFQSYQMRMIEMLLGLDDSERIFLGNTDPLEHIRKMTESSLTGGVVWNELERTREEMTVKDALEKWLHRTPINGSTPRDANDAEVVGRFLEEYLVAYGRLMDMQAEQLVATHIYPEDAVRKRFTENMKSARSFLFAEDVPMEKRDRVKRVRAAILFIESHRDLPLLAWPRILLSKIVELEQLFILWRTRHARMVERLIGRRVGTGGSSGVDYLDETTKYRIFKDLWAMRTILLPKQLVPPVENYDFYRFREEVVTDSMDS